MAKYPTFSIVIETANLTISDLEDLRSALDSIAAQENPSPEQANEVVVVDSGIVAHEDLKEACADYPWVTIHKIEPHTNYYQVKMHGLRQTTGEVVAYLDADCVWQPGALHAYISTFAENPDIHMLAGETSVAVRNPYELAVALVWVMRGFSLDKGLISEYGYNANNFAARRDFLLEFPFPEVPNTYRTTGTLHTRQILRAGHCIWRIPAARSIHRTPSPDIFVRRFMLQGSDSLQMDKLYDQPTAPGANKPLLRRWLFFKVRFKAVMSVSAVRWLYLPFALPVMALGVASYLAGALVGRINPDRIPVIAERMARSG